MIPPKAKQLIQVGNHQIALPLGVTVADWALERVSWQNPRIRSFLGCIRLLEGVLESNYAILHCSPERLLDIWVKVRRVTELIRNKIAPLLRNPSCIPSLESARQSAEMSLEMLERQVLASLDRFPESVPLDQLSEIRKLLCVSIGQLHAFLQDTFGELMACDPRSVHDADYFLSRRFLSDIEEAEWLHSTVDRLQIYLQRLEQVRPLHLSLLAERMQGDETVPGRQAWEGTAVFLEVLLDGLVHKLREVLALRGVRFHELEILDRYALEIPTRCRMLLELQTAAVGAIERIQATVGPTAEEQAQAARDLQHCHSVFSRRIAGLIVEVDQSLRDLLAFIPLWLTGIERRRALLLRRGTEEPAQAPLDVRVDGGGGAPELSK